MKRIIYRYSAVALLSILATGVRAQAVCDIQPPQTDLNNDGLADQYVSPDARIVNSNIDCSFHSVAAGAIVKESDLIANATIETEARVIRSGVTFEAVVKRGARIIDSLVDGAGTEVGENSILRNNAQVVAQSRLAENVRVINATVDNSEIGVDSVIRDSKVTLAVLESDVRVVGDSEIFGSGFTIIRSGTRIRNGASVLGPIDIGSDSRINARVDISGFKFIGANFRIGEDSVISFGGDILGDVTIGKRVTIGPEPDIGNNTTIGSDSNIGFGVEMVNNVIVRQNVTIDDEAFLDDGVIVGRDSILGYKAQVGVNATIGRGVTVGDEAIIGSGAIVKSGASVPAGFIIQPDTVYPNDYSVVMAE